LAILKNNQSEKRIERKEIVTEDLETATCLQSIGGTILGFKQKRDVDTLQSQSYHLYF